MLMLCLTEGLRKIRDGPIMAKRSPVSAGLSSPTLKSILKSLILRRLRTSVTNILSCLSRPVDRRILKMSLAPRLFLGFRLLGFFFPLFNSLLTRPKSQTSLRLNLGLPWTSRRNAKSSGMLRTRTTRANRPARAIITHNYLSFLFLFFFLFSTFPPFFHEFFQGLG